MLDKDEIKEILADIYNNLEELNKVNCEKDKIYYLTIIEFDIKLLKGKLTKWNSKK